MSMTKLMLKIIRFRDVWTRCHSTRVLYTQKRSVGDIRTDLQKVIEKMPRIRPLDQPPKVWQLVEKMDKYGKSIKFSIQEIPENLYEDAIEQLCKYIFSEELLCHYMNARNDLLLAQDMRTLWRLVLTQGISIGVFTDNPNDGKPILVGANALGVTFKNKKDSVLDYQFKTEKLKILLETGVISTKVAYEHYKVDKYLYTVGLVVRPDYRGYGLSQNMLQIRDLIGPMYGIPVTATVFTSTFAQKSAADAGFEEILTKNFSDIVDKDGNEYYPGIKYESFKIMGKKLS